MWLSRSRYEDLVRSEARLERAEAELGAAQSELRRYQDLLTNMAIRVPVAKNQRPSDPFEEDDSQPTVYLTGEDVDPNDFLEKALTVGNASAA